MYLKMEDKVVRGGDCQHIAAPQNFSRGTYVYDFEENNGYMGILMSGIKTVCTAGVCRWQVQHFITVCKNEIQHK